MLAVIRVLRQICQSFALRWISLDPGWNMLLTVLPKLNRRWIYFMAKGWTVKVKFWTRNGLVGVFLPIKGGGNTPLESTYDIQLLKLNIRTIHYLYYIIYKQKLLKTTYLL
jgi:hypothetical protein